MKTAGTSTMSCTCLCEWLLWCLCPCWALFWTQGRLNRPQTHSKSSSFWSAAMNSCSMASAGHGPADPMTPITCSVEAPFPSSQSRRGREVPLAPRCSVGNCTPSALSWPQSLPVAGGCIQCMGWLKGAMPLPPIHLLQMPAQDPGTVEGEAGQAPPWQGREASPAVTVPGESCLQRAGSFLGPDSEGSLLAQPDRCPGPARPAMPCSQVFVLPVVL